MSDQAEPKKPTRWLDLALYAGGVAVLGIGLAIKDVAWAMVAIGAIVSGTVLAANVMRANPRKNRDEHS